MAGSYLHKTPSQNPDSQTTWTISFWIKRCKLTSEQWVLTAEHGDTGNNFTAVYFAANDTLIWREEVSGSDVGALKTNRVFRDTSAWYHIVLKWDTTNATAGDRMKMFINGVEEGSAGGYSTDTQPSQNQAAEWGTQEYQAIGVQALSGNANNHLDAIMTHFHYTDGNAYDASSFGETDATTGEWKINTSPSVTYGTAGFFILKDAYSGTDQSGNSNNWTGAGTGGTNTQDNPSNVFATLQKLFLDDNDLTISQGNTKVVEGSDNWRSAYSSLGASSGKFYCEAKVTYQNNTEAYVGVSHEDHLNNMASYGGSWGGVQNSGYDYVGYSDKSVSIYSNGDQDYPSGVAVGDTWQSSGDIMSIAMDLDNNKVYFAKNGVWANGSGGWGSSTFDSSVGGQTIVSGLTHFGFSPNQSTFEVNFGNGYFGTTAISSEGTNASGIGKFEFDVPAGYTALSTKGLNA